MILLDTTTRSLELSLQSAVSTSQLHFVTGWADNSLVAFTPGASNGVSNNTTPVTLVAAPGASTQRHVKYIHVFNVDTALATVIIRYNDNGTLRTLVSPALKPGEAMTYVDKIGWRGLDAYAAAKHRVWARSRYMDDTIFATFPQPSTGFSLVPGSGTIKVALAVYMGLASRAYRSCQLGLRVTTANTTGMLWAECAILKGEPGIHGGAITSEPAHPTNLTVMGWVDATTMIGTTGLRTVNISLAGINPGDHLYMGFCMAPSVATALNFLGSIGTDSPTSAPLAFMNNNPGIASADNVASPPRFSAWPDGLILQGKVQSPPFFVAQFK